MLKRNLLLAYRHTEADLGSLRFRISCIGKVYMKHLQLSIHIQQRTVYPEAHFHTYRLSMGRRNHRKGIILPVVIPLFYSENSCFPLQQHLQ